MVELWVGTPIVDDIVKRQVPGQFLPDYFPLENFKQTIPNPDSFL